jgi:hypothetical protein
MHLLLKRCAALGFLLFVGLWITGTLRGLSVPFPEPSSWHFASAEYDSRWQPQVANNIKQLGLAAEATPLPAVLDQAAEQIQVFEKRAQLASRSSDFDSDISRIRAAMAAHQAVVQTDKANGIEPTRQLHLQISVPPEKFDSFVAELRQIGILHSISVHQRDRTSEFRKLHAQRQALKKYLEAILKLRGANSPSIDDALKLEQKIQDIERELQSIGAQMGDLLGRESYYQVDMALAEFQPSSKLDPTFTWPKRIMHGFSWALAWWFAALAGVGLIAGTVVSVRVLGIRR